jgi:uncharacterized membrane protein YiaA
MGGCNILFNKMKAKLFTLEKGIFLAIGLPSLFTSLRYYEDLRKAIPKSSDYYHYFSLFIFFLVIGTLFIGLFIGISIAEKNITRNLEKNKGGQDESREATS